MARCFKSRKNTTTIIRPYRPQIKAIQNKLQLGPAIRDTLGQLGAISWRLSGLTGLAQDKMLMAAATGPAKGLKDFVHGTQQLVLHPQETMRQLEQVLIRLDHFVGQLYRNDPEANAKINAAIKACWDCPLDQKVETSFRILVSFGIAPHFANKGIGFVAQAVKDSGLLAVAGNVAKKVGSLKAWLHGLLSGRANGRAWIREFRYRALSCHGGQ